MDYWEDCIGEAFEDAKIVATQEQIENVASWIENAHDNFGMAHGHDCIPNPLQTEIEELKRNHQKEIEHIEKINYANIKDWQDNSQGKNMTIDRLNDRIEELER